MFLALGSKLVSLNKGWNIFMSIFSGYKGCVLNMKDKLMYFLAEIVFELIFSPTYRCSCTMLFLLTDLLPRNSNRGWGLETITAIPTMLKLLTPFKTDLKTYKNKCRNWNVWLIKLTTPIRRWWVFGNETSGRVELGKRLLACRSKKGETDSCSSVL